MRVEHVKEIPAVVELVERVVEPAKPELFVITLDRDKAERLHSLIGRMNAETWPASLFDWDELGDRLYGKNRWERSRYELPNIRFTEDNFKNKA